MSNISYFLRPLGRSGSTGTVDPPRPRGLLFSPSAVASVDRVSRLHASISARLTGLHFQFINVLHRPSHFQAVFDEHVFRLSALAIRLVHNSVVCNDEYRRCLSEWKTFPLTLENHCILLFGSFTKKKKWDPAFKLKELKEAADRARLAGCSLEFLKSLEDRIGDEEFLSEQMIAFIEKMKASMMAGRKSELLRRLSIELEDRCKAGWYVVFNTLTVEPEFYDKVFPAQGVVRSSAISNQSPFP